MSLKVQNLTVELPDGQTLINDLSFEVRRGETLALLGSSGSGKSVTCTAILGLLSKKLSVSGDLFLDRSPLVPEQVRGKRIACILQNPSSAFNPVYTMRQHAAETLKAANRDVEEADIIKAMDDAGLEEIDRVLELYPFQMSGGMLQRMMLALALMSKADYLIADEPTTDLDLIVQSHILDRLETISKERNLGVLLVTHDLGVVARLADNVVVISTGKVVEKQDVYSLFNSPQSEPAKTLMSAHYSLYPEYNTDSASNAEEERLYA